MQLLLGRDGGEVFLKKREADPEPVSLNPF
jgi:hypothetical protein